MISKKYYEISQVVSSWVFVWIAAEFEQTMRKVGIKRVVERIPFFKDFSGDVIDTLVSYLKPQAYSPGIVLNNHLCNVW